MNPTRDIEYRDPLDIPEEPPDPNPDEDGDREIPGEH